MRPTGLFLAAVLLTSGPGRVDACGDKFLRVGRGARYQRAYVAIHPACILLYVNPKSAVSAALRELEPALKRAGHKPVLVQGPSGIAPALKSGHYNLILVDLKDLADIESEMRNATKLDVLPVLHEPTPAARAEAQKDYHCVAETPAKKVEVLSRIDDLMDIVLKGTGDRNRKQP